MIIWLNGVVQFVGGLVKAIYQSAPPKNALSVLPLVTHLKKSKNGIELTEKKSKKVQIEIYTSPTCPYCPAAIRMVQKAVDLYDNALEVTKIDVTTPDGQQLAAFYQVQATPTIVINGEVKFRGPPPSETVLFDEIESFVSKEIAQKATKKRKAQTREMDMMYG